MSKVCAVTGKKLMFGNNVSHARNRTKRVFLPNLQNASLRSEILGRVIKFKSTPNGLRTIEKFGGIDGFLLNAKNHKLTPEFLKLKRQVFKKVIFEEDSLEVVESVDSETSDQN